MSEEKDDNRKLPVKPATPVKRRRNEDDDDGDDLKRDDLKSSGPGLLAKVMLVLLTLALLIPSALSRNPFSAGLGRGHQVGTMGKDKTPVYSADQSEATETWQAMQTLGFEVPSERVGFFTIDRLLDDEVRQFIQEHPSDGFWLLRTWASSVVPMPSGERVAAVINGDLSSLPQFAGAPNLGTLKIASRNGTAQTASAENPIVFAAVRDALLVNQALTRERSLATPSLAMIDNAQSRMFREATGRVVEVDSRDFLAQVPTEFPDDAVKAQLAKYAKVDPALPPSAESPLGFGYRFENRVKLQAIVVRFDDVRAAVRAQRLTENPKAWELAAARLYKDKPELFTIEVDPATSQPVSDAASQPATTKPTTAPVKRLQSFEAVRQKAIDLAIDFETHRRIVGPREPGDPVAPVQERLQQLLRDDFKTWTNAGPKPDDALMAESHLASVAQKIQQQYGFLPTTISLQDRLYSAADLDAQAALGKFETGGLRRGIRPSSIGTYVLGMTRPFVASRFLTRLGDQVLDIGEPSETLVAPAPKAGEEAPTFSPGDVREDVAIVRVVATDLARAAKPEDLTADPTLREKIVRDLRNERAMALARAEAERIQRNAASNGNRLDGVTGGRPVLPEQTISAFDQTFDFSTGRPDLAFVASKQWGPDLAAKLLSPNPAPLVVLDKPGEMKVCVIEFGGTKVIGSSDANAIAYGRISTSTRLAASLAAGRLGTLFSAAAPVEANATTPPAAQIYDAEELRARIGFKASEK